MLTDVSEEGIASIVGVKKSVSEETCILFSFLADF
jgi:hypothetical protein